MIDIKVGGGGGEALEGSLVSYNNGRGENEKKVVMSIFTNGYGKLFIRMIFVETLRVRIGLTKWVELESPIHQPNLIELDQIRLLNASV